MSPVDSAGFEAGKTFSGPVIAMAVAAFVVGGAFAYGIAQITTTNQLISIQQRDAKALSDQVKPRVAAFEEIARKINALDPNVPDFAAASDLAVDTFVVGGTILANVTVPMEGRATSNVASYAADSTQLRSLLVEHNRFTNEVDKEELDALLAENQEVAENSGFGVVVDIDGIAAAIDAGRVLPSARLVGFRRLLDEQKKVEVAILPGGEIRQLNFDQVIPLDKSEVLKAGGQNALQRYSLRVRNLKYHVGQIEKYRASLLGSLDVATGDAAAGSVPEPAGEE